MNDPIDRLNAALEDRYAIVREIGEGGMATVYLADDLRHERKVALKVLKPELAAVVGAERFLAEIKTTANLQHPHILPLFDSGEADGFLFYVMPFIEGETLRDRLDREKQLPVDEAVGIASAVAAALQTAHDAGVVHRDIKPANILMSNGEPLVSDFGIALAVGAAGGNRLTETGLSVGTPYYMSPEQATGDRLIGPASDVYSLACVLYEMLIGEPPYTGSTAQAVLGKIIMGTPVSATAVRASIPPNVDAAIRKSLEKLPADRFPSARAFAGALADATFRHGTEAASTGAGSRGGWTPLTAGFAAVALLALAAALWAWTRPAPTEPVVRLDLDVADLTLTGPIDDIIVSPDGSRFALAGIADGERSLYVRNADEDRFRLIPGTENARYPAFSPDGQWIAYMDTDRDMMFRVSLSGGAPRVVVRGPIDMDFLDWGEDGTILGWAEGPEGEGIYRVPDTGGEPELVLRGALANPRLLPGGRGILATHLDALSTVLIEPAADSARTLIPGGIDATYVDTGHLVYGDGAGGLWAVSFDLDAGTLTGEPVPVLNGLPGNAQRFVRYSVSRNGTLVHGTGSAETGSRDRELLVIDLEGNVDVRPLEPRSFRGLRWSPDGESIVYFVPEGGQAANLFTYNVALRTAPRQLTFEGTNVGPAWSPDGTRIAFSSRREGTDDFDLFVKTVGNDAPPERILGRPGEQHIWEWATDDLITFSDSDESEDIWLVDPADSASVRPYLTAEADLWDFALSPDGTLAAYSSEETSTPEVYVRSFPTPRQPTKVSDRIDAEFPRWAPDGNTIYYWRSTPGADTLFAARLQRVPTFAVLSTEVVLAGDYDRTSWDLHPDGDRLIVTRSVGAARPDEEEGQSGRERFLVVTNWFTELRRALGGR